MPRKGDKCECGSENQIETITGGIIQKVHYKGDFIVKEETTFESNSKHSTYFCPDCEKEI